MDDQNSTEKSVGFFSLSVLLHALVVFGILAGAAYRATQGGGSKGDAETVTMEVVGAGEANDATETQSVEPQKEQIAEKPVVVEKPVEKAKPVLKATTPKAAVVKTKSTQKTPKAIPTETQDSEDAPEVIAGATQTDDANHESATEENSAEKDTETAEEAATPVAATPTKNKNQASEEEIDKEEHQMPAAAAVPARQSIETTKEDGATAAASQAPKGEETATVTQGSGNGEGAAKGDGSGATPADAKDFADLKQKPGNRPPKYPMNARRAKYEGQVELTYFVTKQGTVEQVKVAKSSGYAALDHEAMQAVQNYKYFPGQEGWTSHPVTFSLQGDAQQVGGLRH